MDKNLLYPYLIFFLKKHSTWTTEKEKLNKIWLCKDYLSPQYKKKKLF